MEQRIDEPAASPAPASARANAARANAAPPVAARVAALCSIIFAGVCGGLIGYSVVDLSCSHDCAVAAGVSGVVVAVLTAVGVAIVAVLVLRAMGEWKVGGRRPPQSGADGG